MRIAHASNNDLEAALGLLGLLDALSRGYYPSDVDDDGRESEDTPDDPLYFDEDDPAHLAQAWKRLKTLLDAAPGFQGRVIGGAHALMSPGNAVIDPDDDCLELHPRLKQALEQSARLAMLTKPRPASSWHPRLGAVPRWSSSGTDTPYLGRRRDAGWSQRYTHWTPVPVPAHTARRARWSCNRAVTTPIS